MVNISPVYPTPEHELAAQRIVTFFARRSGVEAVLLVGSCARGRATPDSCLDMVILVSPDAWASRRRDLGDAWSEFTQAEEVFQALLRVGEYSHVDLDFHDGQFQARGHGWTSGPDAFELEIGNLLRYSVPLWEGGSYLRLLQAKWLPYYEETLRSERLKMVSLYCQNNLKHIPLYVERGLYFQSFQRLWHAFGEFLQALFIARRTYPIAYDKWIREQVVEILELPELYSRLTHLWEIGQFESREIAHKARDLEQLFDEFVTTSG